MEVAKAGGMFDLADRVIAKLTFVLFGVLLPTLLIEFLHVCRPSTRGD